MKIRTVIISVVVSGSLVAGIGYGAYYAMRGKSTPVEVVPVANVNSYWGWSGEDSLYGSITSQVAQTVMLNEEYSVDEIFVEEGQQVKEGTPLFSYDMTLPELELEMAKLNLQSQELTMVRLEKDLEKLKNTRATASLSGNAVVLTAASDEDLILEEGSEEVSGAEDASGAAADPGGQDSGTSEDAEKGGASMHGQPGAEGGASSDGNAEGGLSIDRIESVEDPGLAEDGMEEQKLAIRNSVSSYEQLMMAIDVLMQTYGDTIAADDIRDAMTELVAYYRKNLADERLTEETDANGTTVTVRSYVLKESVRDALSEEELKNLQLFAERMELYHAKYTELLIAELDPENPGDFSALVQEARAEYENLTTASKQRVYHIDRLAQMEQLASDGAEEMEEPTGAQGESETDTRGETLPGQETESGTAAESESGTESETAAESESGTESETAAESESGTESGTEAESESGTESGTEAESESGTESGTEAESESGTESETEAESESETESETMTESESETETETEDMQTMLAYIDAFVSLAEEALGADGMVLSSYDVLKLETAIVHYQANLADIDANIVDGSATAMESYLLKQSAVDCLDANGREAEVLYLPQRYKQLCMIFVKTLVDNLDPQSLVRENKDAPLEERIRSFDYAKRAYETLGSTWQAELDANVAVSVEIPQSGDVLSENGKIDPVQTEPSLPEEAPEGETGDQESTGDSAETENGGGTATAVLNYGEKLAAYEVILLIQETEQYLSQPEELLKAYLVQVRDQYLSLNPGQQALVWNSDALIQLLKKYGLWVEEPQTGDRFPDFGDNDLGDFGGEGYTAEQLKELIESTERDIRSCALEIREAELTLEKQKRVVDGKVVKSTMDGTVVSIGTKDGDSENDYFVKVVNQTGLFARGAMNELALQKIRVGDTISGQTDDGMMFTAVIKEISPYPEKGGNMYGFSGTENTNASYYPFYALLDDTEGISEGGATIQLSGESLAENENAIYLEMYFVRTESNGKSYVYKQGENGKLTKQYVTTGKSMYDYAIEIKSGLSRDDKIAFPYGDDVFEGAETKEVDQLEAAYQ